MILDSTCHRLFDQTKTIVRFVNRDYATELVEKANDIRKFDFSDLLGSEAVGTIYCNCNLSPESKHLYWKVKQLKRDGYIAFYGADGMGVYFRKQKRGKDIYVYGNSDLYDYVSPEDWYEYFGEKLY